jgi:hypothetical protein
MPVKRPIRIDGDVAYIPLTQGYEAIIDATDVPLADGWNWSAIVSRRTVYAFRANGSGPPPRTIRLHRAIMGEPDGLQVDHISGDGLDCRRANLRTASHSENMHNRRTPANNKSGVKGVHWNTQRAKWRAQIKLDGKRVFLGDFTDLAEAAAAYAKASYVMHGQFGRLK